jgi:lysophospholipase L1-like esterase
VTWGSKKVLANVFTDAILVGMVATRANAGKHVAVVDMSPPNLTTSDLSDNLHPTVAGYAKMAKQWLGGIQTAASKKWI